MDTETRLCGCGCGTALPPLVGRHGQSQRRFMHGHNRSPVSLPKPKPAVDAPNPAGVCMCGCGQPVPRAVRSNGNNQVAGEFLRYLRGHWPIWETRRNPPDPADPKGPNPSGKCGCGCNAQVGIADRTDPARNMVAGCYLLWLKGHHHRSIPRDLPNPNPSAKCLCGCGLKTPIATFTKTGNVAGFPRLYFDPGHQQRCDYKENAETGCWEMQAAPRSDGYSRLHRKGRLYLSHTWYWEKRYGKVPEGLCLDHLCRNRICVRPEHLELVTHEENSRRVHARKELPQLLECPDPTVDARTGCWIFPIIQPDGYARVWHGQSIRMAHRVFYEREYGRVASDLQLDHLCWNRACVNPSHLEPVNRVENVQRAIRRRAENRP